MLTKISNRTSTKNYNKATHTRDEGHYRGSKMTKKVCWRVNFLFQAWYGFFLWWMRLIDRYWRFCPSPNFPSDRPGSASSPPPRRSPRDRLRGRKVLSKMPEDYDPVTGYYRRKSNADVRVDEEERVVETWKQSIDQSFRERLKTVWFRGVDGLG